MAVQAADVKSTMRDITTNMGVITALMGRKDYLPKEYQEINRRLGAAATLISRAVGAARKMGESTSTNLIDKIDNRIDELDETYDMDFLTDKIIGKKYKGQEIINAVYDDKAGTMIRFWIGKKGKGNQTEIRPIPKDELVKVLK